MKYFLILLFVILLTGCQKAHYIRGTDFVRNYNSTDDVTLLKSGDVVYVIELDTANVVFLEDDGPLDPSKPEDQESLQEYYDWFDMEESNSYGYSDPKEFFTVEYNKNFKTGLQSDRKKRITVKNFKWNDIIELGYKFEIQKTSVEKQDVRVIEPKDLSDFSKKFKSRFSDADYVILMGEFFIYGGVLTYSISYNANNVKHGATILVPKTIIDLNNEMIIAYDLNQTPNLYSFLVRLNPV